MTLRDYQLRAIEGVREHIRAGRRRPCLVMPTGAGKTRTAAEIVRRTVAGGRSVLWLAHRAELVDQAAETLHAQGLLVGAVSASAQTPPNPFAPVQVSTIQTLLSRKVRPTADVLIADECHHFVADSFGAVVRDYPNAHVIGLTATPERSDGRGLGEIFDSIFVGTTIRHLTERGTLVPCEIMRPQRYLASGELAQSPVDAYVQHAGNRKAIVFARSIELAESYAADFCNRGIACRTVSAETPWPERSSALEAFRLGSVRVLTNVFALTEGFDVPDMSCVILARGFGTPGPYLQAVGRALRSAPGKTDALVLDLRGVSHELGRHDDERIFSLDGKGIRSADSMLYCQVCGAARETGEPCTVCGWRPAANEAVGDTVVNEKLERYAEIRRDDDAARIRRLAKWASAARAAGYKLGWAKGKFKAVYGCWPTRDVEAAAMAMLNSEVA